MSVMFDVVQTLRRDIHAFVTLEKQTGPIAVEQTALLVACANLMALLDRFYPEGYEPDGKARKASSP